MAKPASRPDWIRLSQDLFFAIKRSPNRLVLTHQGLDIPNNFKVLVWEMAHGGGRKLKLNPEQLQVLTELNEQKNDATLEELQHHVSVFGAISLNKVVTSINLFGGIDGLTFEAFIIQKLVPKLWKGAVVLLDNYSIHQGENIEKALLEAGAELIYLQPYSPDFSPIENF